jgi:hypothetical protein
MLIVITQVVLAELARGITCCFITSAMVGIHEVMP